MLITKQQKRAAYVYLLDEGVIVIKKVLPRALPIGCSPQETPRSRYAQSELDLHNEDLVLEEVRERDLLLELVLLHGHQGRR